jgi:hypothetical protein
MTVVPSTASPLLPPCAGVTADDLRAAQDFARRQPGWVVEALVADEGAALLGLTPPRSDGGGDLAWVIERTEAWLRVYDADCSVLGEFGELQAALEAIRLAEAARSPASAS